MDPSLFALPEDGCTYVKIISGDAFNLPFVGVECDESIYFNECVENKIDGIPSVTIVCEGDISFSNCKPFTIDGLPPVTVKCDEDRSADFSDCNTEDSQDENSESDD